MTCVRSEIVSFVNKYFDKIEHYEFMESKEHQQNFVKEVRKQFPNITRGDLQEVFNICAFETKEAQRDEKRKSDELHAIVRFYQRHQIPDETPWIEAVRMIAGRGDVEAQAILADLESPAANISHALFEAAVEAHPAWRRDGRHFVFSPEIGGPEDDVGLIDWFQRTHPQEASSITSQITNNTGN